MRWRYLCFKIHFIYSQALRMQESELPICQSAKSRMCKGNSAIYNNCIRTTLEFRIQSNPSLSLAPAFTSSAVPLIQIFILKTFCSLGEKNEIIKACTIKILSTSTTADVQSLCPHSRATKVAVLLLPVKVKSIFEKCAS